MRAKTVDDPEKRSPRFRDDSTFEARFEAGGRFDGEAAAGRKARAARAIRTFRKGS
jgi:hypothetical protein